MTGLVDQNDVLTLPAASLEATDPVGAVPLHHVTHHRLALAISP